MFKMVYKLNDAVSLSDNIFYCLVSDKFPVSFCQNDNLNNTSLYSFEDVAISKKIV